MSLVHLILNTKRMTRRHSSVALSRKQGFALRVILKHQEFPTKAELTSLQKHCPQTTLIPGAEINVLVDALSKKIGKDYFVHCIVAVDPDAEGEYNFVLQKAKETFSYRSGEYPAGFRSGILDLGKFFGDTGRIYSSHLHQSKSRRLHGVSMMCMTTTPFSALLQRVRLTLLRFEQYLRRHS